MARPWATCPLYYSVKQWIFVQYIRGPADRAPCMQAPPPFPLIELSGPPRERGRSHGEQAAERIRRGVAMYAAQLAGLQLGAAEVRRLAEGYLPRIEAFDPLYVEEMRGIAEGAGLELADIVMINARTEVLRLGLQRSQEAQADDHPDGCTGAVLLPETTAHGRLLHGQNWDWKAECAETTVVLRIRRDDGPDILTLTEAGGLARCGLNSAGIAITANYLTSDRDYRHLGVPLALLRRKVLETEHLALALQAVYCTAKSGSNNLMISHADGVALDIECAPDESFLVGADQGLLVHANHWQSAVALGKLRESGVQGSPCTLYRDLRVRQRLQARRGQLTLDDLRAAFFDDFASPWSVCRPPRLNTSSNLSASVAMVVMEPALGLMDVAMLPALNRSFTTYTLAMDRTFGTEAAGAHDEAGA